MNHEQERAKERIAAELDRSRRRSNGLTIEALDDEGLLALSMSLPVTMPPLEAVAKDPSLVARTGGSVWERVHGAKPVLLQRITYLTGSILSLVDIRVTGVRVQEGSRVR